MGRPEKAAWEIKNEKNKAGVRWLLAVVVSGYLGYLIETGIGSQIGGSKMLGWFYVAGVSAFVVIANLAVTLAIREGNNTGAFSPVIKYITMVADLVAVSLVLIPTGGSESMFFIVYFIVIVSNALRYGMRLAIVGVMSFNVLYVLVLTYQYFPRFDIPGFQKEILKVSGFWLVGLYTGYLSRRFELLQGEVEKYEKLVASLVAEKQAK